MNQTPACMQQHMPAKNHLQGPGCSTSLQSFCTDSEGETNIVLDD
jgi:hypothetical protein